MYGTAVLGPLNFKLAPQNILKKMLHIKEMSKICIPNGFTIGSVSQMLDLKQDSQCTYDVTFRRVRATFVAVEKQ
jgi:hypothetical protein